MSARIAVEVPYRSGPANRRLPPSHGDPTPTAPHPATPPELPPPAPQRSPAPRLVSRPSLHLHQPQRTHRPHPSDPLDKTVDAILPAKAARQALDPGEVREQRTPAVRPRRAAPVPSCPTMRRHCSTTPWPSRRARANSSTTCGERRPSSSHDRSLDHEGAMTVDDSEELSETRHSRRLPRPATAIRRLDPGSGRPLKLDRPAHSAYFCVLLAGSTKVVRPRSVEFLRLGAICGGGDRI
jgi:hypothetical protein